MTQHQQPPQTVREYLLRRIKFYEDGDSETPPKLTDIDCDRIVVKELTKVLEFITNGPS